ncbi:hypothetical protein BD310DRAFT_930458 [Dichomitus squalens]|uniref:Uncharacterized protein n=1 Tax=Dichomitus squalens TaxID=114155 RepID=A0A4Q9PRH0_9APHY|nr:hypothetical protein BD310DRAFT_930458 [Dichomitus squalens]
MPAHRLSFCIPGVASLEGSGPRLPYQRAGTRVGMVGRRRTGTADRSSPCAFLPFIPRCLDVVDKAAAKAYG